MIQRRRKISVRLPLSSSSVFFKEDVNVEASTPKLNCSTSSMFLAFVPSLWKSHTTKRGSTLCDLHKTTRKWLSCFTEHKIFYFVPTLYAQSVCLFSSFCLAPSPYLRASFLYICCMMRKWSRVGLCWSSLEETLKRKETKKKTFTNICRVHHLFLLLVHNYDSCCLTSCRSS